MTQSHVTFLLAGPVATITLNNSRRGNAFTEKMIEQFLSHLTSISQNPTIRVLVITGIGKYFCTGLDLSTPMNDPHEIANQFTSLCDRLRNFPLPIIARLNGPAIGGGIGLAFLADIRIARDTMYFQFAEVYRGLVPAMISTHIIPQLGTYLSKELMLTGRKFSADNAKEVGAISEVGKSMKDVDIYVSKYINYLLFAAPNAVAEMKNLVKYVSAHSYEENVHEAKETFKRVAVSPEAKYGRTSFLRKTKPDWGKLIKSKL